MLASELKDETPVFFPSQVPLPTFDEGARNVYLADLLNSTKISPTETIEPPIVAWEIKNKEGGFDTLGTCGNFSVIIGKAKSRKSFLINIGISAATKNGLVLDLIKSEITERPEVLYFDTEQSKYHVQLSLKRICRQINIDDPLNLHVYGLRKHEPHIRLELIEYAIYNNDNVGFVVIDGIKDLITSINDEEQATMIASKLLKWTEERNVHIVTVLHQNKSDTNARGHVGTELTNKAETVLSVTKAEGHKDISIVEAQQCRNKEPEPFGFEIIDGLPVFAQNWQERIELKKGKPVKAEIESHQAYQILTEIFSNGKSFGYAELQRQVQVVHKKQLSRHLADNAAKGFISICKHHGWLTQAKEKGPYILGDYSAAGL
jgi:hypothetical protein